MGVLAVPCMVSQRRGHRDAVGWGASPTLVQKNSGPAILTKARDVLERLTGQLSQSSNSSSSPLGATVVARCRNCGV